MDTISQFVLKQALSIAFGQSKKLIPHGVEVEINEAFENALKKWSVNSTIRKQKRGDLQRFISEESVRPSTTAGLSNELLTFLGHFQICLSEKSSAHAYIKEKKDERRHEETVALLKGSFSNRQADDSKLIMEWERQLDAYSRSISEFKPKTALSLLEDLLKALEENHIDGADLIKSRLSTLKSECYEQLGLHDKVYEEFISWHLLDPTSIEFKRKACYAYARTEQHELALQLSKELIEKDADDPAAHAVQVMLSQVEALDLTLASIPQNVLRDTAFRRNVYFTLRARIDLNGVRVLKDYGIVSEDLEDFAPVNWSNFRDRIFKIEVIMSNVFGQGYIDFNELNLDNIDTVKYLDSLLSDFIAAIDASEIKERFKAYEVILAYTKYVIKRDSKSALFLFSQFQQVDTQDYLILHVSNALQLSGNYQEALEVIGKMSIKTSELLLLQSMCFLKSGDKEGYKVSAVDFVNSLTKINSSYAPNIFLILYNFHRFGCLERLGSEFVADKDFDIPELKDYIVAMYLALVNGESKEGIEPYRTLIQHEKLVLDLDDDRQAFMLAYTYQQIHRIDDCYRVFNLFLKKEQENEFLGFYIDFLFQNKIHHDELLVLLERWRTRFSYVDVFLRMEADLRREISDWQTCCDICEKILAKKPLDEAALVVEICALNQMDTEQSRRLIAKKSKAFVDFKFSSYNWARQVIEVLIENDLQEIGLSILYEYAKDENNQQARLQYINAFITCQNLKVRENDTVELNWFVTYETQGVVKFLEIKEGSPAQKLIGHKVGDVVQLSNKLAGSSVSVQITRITDKYLHLHDAIWEEVKSDPFTKLPFTSFQFPANPTKEEMDRVFIEMFGVNGQLEKENSEKNLNDYYSYKLSFSEIIMRNFRGELFGGYFNLAHQERGIVQLPRSYYPTVLSLASQRVYIDASSLLILYQISRDQGLTYDGSLIISNTLVDLIKGQLKEEQKTTSEQFSASITLDGVLVHKKSLDQTKANAQYYLNLLDWITENCEIKFPVEKLDITRRLEGERHNPISDLFVENGSFLLNDSAAILITDDLLFSKVGSPKSGQFISSEVFCELAFGLEPSIRNRYSTEFLKNKYHGFSITTPVLVSQFQDYVAGKNNEYLFCLSNLSIARYRNPQAVLVAIDFMKEIVLGSPLPSERMKREFINLLVSVLAGHSDLNTFKAVERQLQVTFKLLGNKLDFVLNCYMDALTIMNHG